MDGWRELRDGTLVFVRPIAPEDRETLRAGFEQLSDESRYRRFFSPVSRLTERQLDYLTRVDHHDHEALLALDADGDAVGVARYLRTGPGVAEPAVAVIDAWHGRGVASVLLDLLAERAREEGITRFVAPVLAQNTPAMRALQAIGPTSASLSGNEAELTIELPAVAGRGPSLGAVLRAVAAGKVQPAISFWHRLTPRRRPLRDDAANVIVVGLEAAGGPGPAIRIAGRIAGATGAGVQLVTAQRPLLDDRAALDERLRGAAAELERAGLDVEVQLRLGDFAAVLLDVAVEERARLIVVDDPPASAPGRLLGEAWEHVSHHAPCDVLIAREKKVTGT